MTQLKLDTLSDRIKAHKTALVHIVKPPVCTERAQHYTEMYQQHLDKPIPVRRALALAHHLVKRRTKSAKAFQIKYENSNFRASIETVVLCMSVSFTFICLKNIHIISDIKIFS